MVHVMPLSGTLPYTFNKNKRAADLLACSSKKHNLDIKGNVLIFGSYSNETSLCHPYFITD